MRLHLRALSHTLPQPPFSLFFFFNDTATTEIYTLSLHDALPICERRLRQQPAPSDQRVDRKRAREDARHPGRDRKSTRLNSSHLVISYAVFCLKKKKKKVQHNALLLQYR